MTAWSSPVIVALEGVDGGYWVSEEFAKAMGIMTAERAEQAKDN